MAIRKNTKRIDPRYFLHETTNRDEIKEGFDSPEWANFDNKMVPKEVVAQVKQAKGPAWWKRNVVHPGVDRVTDMKQALGPWNKDDPDYDPNDLQRFGLA